MMRAKVLFCLGIVAAVGAALLTLFVCGWFLALRSSSLDALWQLPVLLCYPLWLLAALAVPLVYFSGRSSFRTLLIVSCGESVIAALIWIAVRNVWVLGR